jgi:hypothetical protein
MLSLASFVICAIVIASFAVFAVDKTSGASKHQQAVVAGAVAAPSPSDGASPSGEAQRSGTSAPSKQSTVRKTLDEASGKLTSPFAGVISNSSEWASRGVKLALALLVYGFGLGYLARMLRVRV